MPRFNYKKARLIKGLTLKDVVILARLPSEDFVAKLEDHEEYVPAKRILRVAQLLDLDPEWMIQEELVRYETELRQNVFKT